MTDTKQIAEILHEAVNEHGLLSTLYSVFGPRINFSIPMTSKTCDTPLDNMEFSVRASNALKRAGMFQVRQIVDVINQEELPRIRNLGKKTENVFAGSCRKKSALTRRTAKAHILLV